MKNQQKQGDFCAFLVFCEGEPKLPRLRRNGTKIRAQRLKIDPGGSQIESGGSGIDPGGSKSDPGGSREVFGRFLRGPWGFSCVFLDDFGCPRSSPKGPEVSKNL